MSKDRDKIDEMISSVDGGCSSSICELVREHLDKELEELSQDETDRIDEAIFTCEQCGWTMPIDEQADEDDSICRECQDE